jgi:hypothetical protein
MPCKINQALCRLMQAPEISQTFTACTQQKAPDRAFFAEDHVVEASRSFVTALEIFRFVPNQNYPRPPRTPPITVPCPLRNLVAEW